MAVRGRRGQEAQDFYKKFGFRQTDVVENYYKCDPAPVSTPAPAPVPAPAPAPAPVSFEYPCMPSPEHRRPSHSLRGTSQRAADAHGGRWQPAAILRPCQLENV